MRDESVSATIQKALIGALMALVMSQLLIRSASLTGPAYVPWLWAVGFVLTDLLSGVGFRSFPPPRMRLAGALPFLLAMAGALVPLTLQNTTAMGIQPSAVWPEVRQLLVYLAGADLPLPEALQVLGVHWVCGVSALTLFLLRAWPQRSGLLGAVLVFGIIRWYQVVPGMEEPIRNAALVWILSAAAEASTPAGTGSSANITARVLMALLLTAGVFAGSTALATLFPLDSVNHWIGARLPAQDRFRNEYTQYASTGFTLSDTLWHPLGERLGGAVTLERRPVMEVHSSRPGLYLRGAVKTVYTGQSWEPSDLPAAPGGPETLSGGAEPFVLTVHPFNSGDQTLYTPLHTDRIMAAGRKILTTGEGVFRFGFQWIPQPKQEYRVEGYLLAPPPSSEPDLASYLRLPALSDELKTLTASITAGQETDEGRMARLVTWLRAEGTYRLDVAAPDPGRDFVEQFVLGSRQGYCTYYATALAVMGRLSGVPTRYVEGYHLPEAFTGRQTYLITSDRAHAWVEAYIADKGWITYEPTPAFGNGGQVSAPPPVPGLAVNSLEGEDVPDGDAPAGLTEGFSDSLRGLFGFVLLMPVLLLGLRAAWVERSWRRGVAGAQGDLWRLYAILSALELLAPELKRLGTPAEQLRAANAIFPFRGFASHDIIGEANRLLYGIPADEPAGFKELLTELWDACRVRQSTGWYLYQRYISLALFNSYTPLISYRQHRKDVHHGADQPHTSPQS